MLLAVTVLLFVSAGLLVTVLKLSTSLSRLRQEFRAYKLEESRKSLEDIKALKAVTEALISADNTLMSRIEIYTGRLARLEFLAGLTSTRD